MYTHKFVVQVSCQCTYSNFYFITQAQAPVARYKFLDHFCLYLYTIFYYFVATTPIYKFSLHCSCSNVQISKSFLPVLIYKFLLCRSCSYVQIFTSLLLYQCTNFYFVTPVAMYKILHYFCLHLYTNFYFVPPVAMYKILIRRSCSYYVQTSKSFCLYLYTNFYFVAPVNKLCTNFYFIASIPIYKFLLRCYYTYIQIFILSLRGAACTYVQIFTSISPVTIYKILLRSSCSYVQNFTSFLTLSIHQENLMPSYFA